ncbi:MAG TPA: AgmX/PglI C-terminal domain-containing protein [Polyangiaceae bacterium]|nr:AgmX/PglI C-terminal domain-containing protein [Polyangiaceae bacterium]
MTRSLFVFLAACGSNAPPRTEIAIAPPPSATTTPIAVSVSMNVETPPDNNESDENALVIRMTEPKNTSRGIPVVHVSTDATMVGLPREVIRRVVRQNVAPIRTCYEKALRAKPDLAGRVVVRFKIDAAGNVATSESTSATTLASPDAVACVVDAFKPLVFPEPEGGAVIVNYPIVFAP